MADQIEMGKNVEEEDNQSTGVDNSEFCSGDPVGNANVNLEEVYEYKRKELDKIHQDLNELMDRLNTFITDQDDLCESENDVMNKVYEDDLSEKQDGPQEKELLKQKYCKGLSSDDIYICNGDNPPEVDWETLAPFIQSVVGDLKKIRQLNQMTNSVMERIRSLTGKNQTYQEDN